MPPKNRPDCCHHHSSDTLALFDAFKRTRGQRAGARPAALAERAERASEASGTTSKTGSAALDQSEGSCWWATQARFSSCDSELRLQPQLDTPIPLGRGSRHAPNESVCLLRLGTVVDFLLVLPVGTDWCRKLALSCGSSAAARHTEPPGAWLQPRPEQTGASAALRYRHRLPLRPQIRALTKLALSCGLSRSSTHRAPWSWGVAPATPRTKWCACR